MSIDINRRKKIQFRCWHRGTREMDLILGRFIDHLMNDLSETDLSEADFDFFEIMLSYTDDVLYKLIAKHGIKIPDDLNHPIFKQLVQFYDKK